MGDQTNRPPQRAGLELWPILLDGLLPNWADIDRPAEDVGRYVLRTDEPGGKPGSWIATVTPNPALDVPSRERVARLMANASTLWQSLRWAVDHLAAEHAEDNEAGQAIALLADSGGYVTVGGSVRQSASDTARRGVNNETLYRLVPGSPADDVPSGNTPPAAPSQSAAVRFWLNGTTPVPLGKGERPPEGFDALTATGLSAKLARLANWTPDALCRLHAAMCDGQAPWDDFRKEGAR